MPRTPPITNHFEAAALLADDVPVTEVARQLGVSRKTIYTWSESDEFRALVAEIRADVRAAVKHLAVANKTRRLHLAQEMVDGLLAVVADRKRDGRAAKQPMPGQRSGHVVVKETYAANGLPQKEAAFDAAIHSSLVKWLEYAAKELGEADAKVDVRHSGRVSHTHHERTQDLSMLSDDELDRLAELAAKVEAGSATG